MADESLYQAKAAGRSCARSMQAANAVKTDAAKMQ
jgi:hypothetical protein